MPERGSRNGVLCVPYSALNAYPGFDGIRSNIQFMEGIGFSKDVIKSLFGRGSKEGIDIGAIDETILMNVNKAFELNMSHENVQSFLLSQLKKANDTVVTIGEIIGLPPSVYTLHNEVEIVDPSIVRSLRLLERDRIDPILRFEEQRQLALAYLSAGINARTRGDHAYDVLSALQSGMNESFFLRDEENLLGHYEQEMVTSFHHPVTNKTIAVSSNKEDTYVDEFSNALIKNTLMPFRKISVNGKVIKVLCAARKKNDETAMIKAIKKSNSEKKNINFQEDVRDSLGLRFVVNGNKEDLDLVVNRFFAFLHNYNSDIMLPEDDSQIDKHEGQNEDVNFKRYQISIPGLSVPIEVMFFDLPNYFNYYCDIGTKGGNNNFYNGIAHSLYEIRRTVPVANIIFPKKIYGVDVSAYAEQRSNAVATELKRKTFVPLFN